MPYIDRKEQFKKTLDSFGQYKKRKDFEIILAIDVKNRDDIQYLKSTIPIVKVATGSKDCFNPSKAFNVAAGLAKGKFLVVTNPECLHASDILGGLDEGFDRNPNAYVVCACESVGLDGRFHMWYQHSEHRNERYHFCNALSAENYRRVGGFDERYCDGVGYDDNDFRDAVENAGIPFILRDDLLSVHRWHPKIKAPDYKARLAKNRALYESKWK
jgi:hypothetical protein